MPSDYSLSLPRAEDIADPTRARCKLHAEGVPSDPRPFGVLRLDGPAGETVSLFVYRAVDLDALIGQATRLRAELRQAGELALVEEAERQMEPHPEDAHADSAPHG